MLNHFQIMISSSCHFGVDYPDVCLQSTEKLVFNCMQDCQYWSTMTFFAIKGTESSFVQNGEYKADVFENCVSHNTKCHSSCIQEDPCAVDVDSSFKSFVVSFIIYFDATRDTDWNKNYYEAGLINKMI